MNRLLFTVIITCLFTFASSAQTSTDGIKKESTEASIKIFPNPAANLVNVLGLQNSNTSDITILDMYGNVVLRHHWEIRNNALNIPISSLESGVYMISIISKEQQIQTKFYKK